MAEEKIKADNDLLEEELGQEDLEKVAGGLAEQSSKHGREQESKNS